MKNHFTKEEFILKAKTREQVSNEYGITVKTLNRWLERKQINIPQGLIDPYNLKIIYETFGVPKMI